MIGPVVVLGAFAGLVALLEPPENIGAYGLAPAAHARKVHPWVVRLDAARDGLQDALKRRDRTAVVSGFADVWFWIGRVVCDALSASEDPIHGPVVSAAGMSVHAAWQTAQEARVFLTKD